VRPLLGDEDRVLPHRLHRAQLHEPCSVRPLLALDRSIIVNPRTEWNWARHEYTFQLYQLPALNVLYGARSCNRANQAE
jgi:hypothetical protein